VLLEHGRLHRPHLHAERLVCAAAVALSAFEVGDDRPVVPGGANQRTQSLLQATNRPMKTKRRIPGAAAPPAAEPGVT
jgi:hypothetical protein